MELKMLGKIRGLFATNGPEGREEEQIWLNSRGDQLIAQSLPELTEIVRLGQSFQVSTSAAFAPLATIPTTTAALSLYNNEPDGGKCLIIDSVFLLKVANDASGASPAIQAMISAGAVTANAGTLTPRSLIGLATVSTNALITPGATVANHGWYPLGSTCPVVPAATAEIGQQIDVPVRGLYIVPPKRQFNLHVIQTLATAASCQIGVRWHEAQIVWRTS